MLDEETTAIVESPEYLQTEEMLGEIATIRQQNQQFIETFNALQRHKNGSYFDVKLIDANMPLSAMVGLFIKIALASIPALIILLIMGAFLSVVFGGFFAALIGG